MEDTDWADYKTILFNHGKIEGIVASCKVEEFINKVGESFKDSFSKAKGILITLRFHKNQSLSLNDYMLEIGDLVHGDAEIIIATEIIDNIDEGILEYQIIVTGL